MPVATLVRRERVPTDYPAIGRRAAGPGSAGKRVRGLMLKNRKNVLRGIARCGGCSAGTCNLRLCGSPVRSRHLHRRKGEVYNLTQGEHHRGTVPGRRQPGAPEQRRHHLRRRRFGSDGRWHERRREATAATPTHVTRAETLSAIDLTADPARCVTTSHTPTTATVARIDSWASLQGSGPMSFSVHNVVSTDGGANWIALDSHFGRDSAPGAGLWGYATTHRSGIWWRDRPTSSACGSA